MQKIILPIFAVFVALLTGAALFDIGRERQMYMSALGVVVRLYLPNLPIFIWLSLRKYSNYKNLKKTLTFLTV
ncbi:hypothetical protein [Okeania sp. SIO1I7]|uniref:hypothetical protein n=1 Tax=Okeania sp. SIO1I7 TaxID=2607772 RepID=UPI0013FA6CE6|nr:hypothetical protein [Okeania sp. SIO1I7]NET26435.1 D-alanine--poly(phosphoribitol) ligase [Okeania sp. SIO1I7]